MKIKIISKLICLVAAVGLFVSCSSDEDKLVGSWTRSFGINSASYTEMRSFQQEGSHPTFFHTFTFEKGNGEMGKFVDVVYPLALGGNNEPKVGSKITGNWKVKDGKLYLYYNNDYSLTHADELDPEVRSIIEEQAPLQFLAKYKEAGERGFPYEIVEKNNKTGLEIDFGTDKLVFSKDKDKE